MKIGLALSGGGTLGIAHVGALRQIENNVKIDSICGVSAGAIAGLLYAYGGIAAVDYFYAELIATNPFSPKNIITLRSPEKIFAYIEGILEKVVTINDFNDLPIKFSCIATNIETAQPAILEKGNPIKAVMASAAYPGVFPVQTIGKEKFIDGGVTINMPVTPLLAQNMDFIIASSVISLSKFGYHKKTSRAKVVTRAVEIMENHLNDLELAQANFVFKPPVGKYYWFNFSKLEHIKEIGEKYAKKRIKELVIE
jgi:NTE family protein